MGHATFRAGDLTAVIGDNAADGNHRAGYNGLWSLTHTAEPVRADRGGTQPRLGFPISHTWLRSKQGVRLPHSARLQAALQPDGDLAGSGIVAQEPELFLKGNPPWPTWLPKGTH
jgi:hypothetical protein